MNSHDVFLNQQLLIKKILDRPIGYEWTVQGLGMMRLYLSDEVRVHIWHSSIVVPDVTSIHDHPWSFESLVLAGEMRNHRYLLAEDTHPEAKPHYRDTLLCGTGQLANDPVCLGLIPWHPGDVPSIYLPGATYSQRYDEIHMTSFVDGTVTLVKRDFVNEDRDHAYVYWPYGRQFVSAEPRPAIREEVLTVAEAALDQLR